VTASKFLTKVHETVKNAQYDTAVEDVTRAARMLQSVTAPTLPRVKAPERPSSPAPDRECLTPGLCQKIFVKGDGNCMYHSIAYWLNREAVADTWDAEAVRVGLLSYIHHVRNSSDRHKFWVTDATWDSVVKRVQKDFEWGESEELSLLANQYGVCIVVHLENGGKITTQFFAPNSTPIDASTCATASNKGRVWYLYNTSNKHYQPLAPR